MPWTELTSTDTQKLSVYQSILDEQPAYEGSDSAGLRRLLLRGCKLFLFESGPNKIALAIEKRGQTLHVVNGVPSGAANGERFATLVLNKIEDEMEASGCTEYVAKVDDSSRYSALMNSFLSHCASDEDYKATEQKQHGKAKMKWNRRRLSRRANLRRADL